MAKKKSEPEANFQDDLWPTELHATDIQMPGEILRQQAVILARRTNFTLRAEVDTKTTTIVKNREPADGIVHKLVIIAPLLDNYRFELLRATHALTGYPCSVTHGRNANINVDDDNSFRRALQEIFGSDEVRNVISSLLAQSRR